MLRRKYASLWEVELMETCRRIKIITVNNLGINNRGFHVLSVYSDKNPL